MGPLGPRAARVDYPHVGPYINVAAGPRRPAEECGGGSPHFFVPGGIFQLA